MSITIDILKVGETYQGTSYKRKVLFIGDTTVFYKSIDHKYRIENCMDIKEFLSHNSLIQNVPEKSKLTLYRFTTKNISTDRIEQSTWGSYTAEKRVRNPMYDILKTEEKEIEL